jgi:hypothetical protein
VDQDSRADLADEFVVGIEDPVGFTRGGQDVAGLCFLREALKEPMGRTGGRGNGCYVYSIAIPIVVTTACSITLVSRTLAKLDLVGVLKARD